MFSTQRRWACELSITSQLWIHLSLHCLATVELKPVDVSLLPWAGTRLCYGVRWRASLGSNRRNAFPFLFLALDLAGQCGGRLVALISVSRVDQLCQPVLPAHFPSTQGPLICVLAPIHSLWKVSSPPGRWLLWTTFGPHSSVRVFDNVRMFLILEGGKFLVPFSYCFLYMLLWNSLKLSFTPFR